MLCHNLRGLLTGDPLRKYRPQKDYLKLISMGSREALGERFGTTLAGPMMWSWKDRIDQAFMEKFRDLPAMDPPDLPAEHTQGMEEALGDKPLCGGCGAKVGRGALLGTLAGLNSHGRDDITPLPGDDAALLTTGGVKQVISTDHLRSFTNDPVMMARIAAVHALGDIWAMGAEPQAATANLILPRMSPDLQARTLQELMAAATEVMQDAGAAIIGGHTSLGDELTVGFTVTGLCPRPAITLAGAKPGDALILTKPIGSGVLMAAEMAGDAKGDWVAAALEQMSQPQGAAARILQDAHAMTDVTGFGLLGHLLGICEASRAGAEVFTGQVPLMQGAAELAERGIRSSLLPANQAALPELKTMRLARPAVRPANRRRTPGGCCRRPGGKPAGAAARCWLPRSHYRQSDVKPGGNHVQQLTAAGPRNTPGRIEALFLAFSYAKIFPPEARCASAQRHAQRERGIPDAPATGGSALLPLIILP